MPTIATYSSNLLPCSETFIREQLLALRRWHPVLVGERLLEGGLPLDGLDVRLLRDPRAPGGRWGYTACKLLGLTHPGSLRRLRETGASSVHAHFGTSAVDVWPLARELGLPMLVTLHGYDITIRREWWETGHSGLRRRRYPRDLLEMASHAQVHFVAVSEALRLRAIQFGIPAEKIHVRYIGIDTRKFVPGEAPMSRRAMRILYVGRLVEKKGVACLVRAFAAIRRRVPDAELVIAGDGPLRSALQQQATALGLPVVFLGSLDSGQVRANMHQARVLCLPSVTAANGDAEGFGLVLLEAQACGLPVVTSALGGAKEGIIEGETGFAFNEGDHARLGELLASILPDARRLQRMSGAATEFVRSKYDLRHHTAMLEMDYDQLLAASG